MSLRSTHKGAHLGWAFSEDHLKQVILYDGLQLCLFDEVVERVKTRSLGCDVVQNANYGVRTGLHHYMLHMTFVTGGRERGGGRDGEE